MPRIAILEGYRGFGRKRRAKKSAKRKTARKSHRKSHRKARGGQAAQRNRFKAAASACKVEVVAQIRKSSGPVNPFKAIGACMRRKLRKG